MRNMTHLEDYFKKFTVGLAGHLPEGVSIVDIHFLEKYNLVKTDLDKGDPALTRYFHVMEAPEKITLVNDQFIVWIVPENTGQENLTIVLVALNQDDNPRLETAFITSGVYNTSKLVLRVLEKVLFEIQENEDVLRKLY